MSGINTIGHRSSSSCHAKCSIGLQVQHDPATRALSLLYLARRFVAAPTDSGRVAQPPLPQLLFPASLRSIPNIVIHHNKIPRITLFFLIATPHSILGYFFVLSTRYRGLLASLLTRRKSTMHTSNLLTSLFIAMGALAQAVPEGVGPDSNPPPGCEMSAESNFTIGVLKGFGKRDYGVATAQQVRGSEDCLVVPFCLRIPPIGCRRLPRLLP